MRGGDYVLMARRRAGFTQRELAERLGVRQATIARWERGDRQVGIEDVEAVAAACGLQLEAHLAVEDRSWWSQIALQLELDPLDRVRRLAPPGSSDLAAGLTELAAAQARVVVVGEVAGALHGWPLILGDGVIDVCAEEDEELVATDARVRRVKAPSGTAGFADLRRGAEPIETPGGTLHVAGLLDLLRIADASTARTARRDALALQGALDVCRARSVPVVTDDRASAEKIDAWLKRQAPISM